MEVNYKEIRNNSMFYELVKDNRVLFTGIPKEIMDKFRFTESNWVKLQSRKESIDGMTVRQYSRINILFEHKGFIGTRDEIRDEFDYKQYVFSQGLVKLERVGYFFDCDADNRMIVEEEPKIEKVKPIEVKKKKIDSPNQKYIDYLLESTFKGWRA